MDYSLLAGQLLNVQANLLQVPAYQQLSKMVRGDFATAGSVMFMLRLGEILEEWTHKKSVPDLASAMSLRIENAWQQVDGTEVLTKVTDVKLGDRIVIRAAAQYLHIGHRPEKHDRSVGGRKYTEEKCALSAFLFCAS